MTKKIMIDPGHGGQDPGASGNGLIEKYVVFDIARRIKKYLDEHYEGHITKLTRTSYNTLTLTQRTNLANHWGADVFVSTHINAGGGTGFESYIYNGRVSNNTVKLQNSVHSEVIKETGIRDRGKKKANFAVLRQTKMSALLTENLFIDTKEDADKLKQSSFLDKLAKAHAVGIANFLQLKKKANKSKPGKKESGKLYKVQVGAYANKDNALKMSKRLEKAGFPNYIKYE